MSEPDNSIFKLLREIRLEMQGGFKEHALRFQALDKEFGGLNLRCTASPCSAATRRPRSTIDFQPSRNVSTVLKKTIDYNRSVSSCHAGRYLRVTR